MSSLGEYFAFAHEHPELFVNPSQGGFTILLEEKEIREVEAQMELKLVARGLPVAWSQVGIVYQDQHGRILRDAVRFPDGSSGTLVRSVHEKESKPGVVTWPVYQGNILLLRHFRHATRTWHLEIPQGFGMPGLTSKERARQELKEEIDAQITRLVPLGQLYPDTRSSSSLEELFYAEIESYGSVELHEGISEVRPTPIKEVERMIRTREITSLTLLAAYTRASIAGLLPQK